MRRVLQFLVPVLGVILVWILSGSIPAALWLAGLLLVAIIANKLASAAKTLTVISILAFGSLIVTVAGAVALFIFFGWLPAVAAIILWGAYIYLKPHVWE
jgi:hypothetical protein